MLDREPTQSSSTTTLLKHRGRHAGTSKNTREKAEETVLNAKAVLIQTSFNKEPIYEFKRKEIEEYVSSIKHKGNFTLSSEIDQSFRKVSDCLAEFEDTLTRYKTAFTTNQREKLEMDLKREMKKVQRQRDQIKLWLNDGTIKDKSLLEEMKLIIEAQMERYKTIERECKAREYSDYSLKVTKVLTPLEQEERDLNIWLDSSIQSLQLQIDSYELEIDSIVDSKKKKLLQQEQIDAIKVHVNKHNFHIGKLETIMRILTNVTADTDMLSSFIPKVIKIKDDMEYYIEASREAEYEDNEFLYEEIDEIEKQGFGNLKASPNISAAEPNIKIIPTEISPKSGTKSPKSPTKELKDAIPKITTPVLLLPVELVPLPILPSPCPSCPPSPPQVIRMPPTISLAEFVPRKYILYPTQSIPFPCTLAPPSPTVETAKPVSIDLSKTISPWTRKPQKICPASPPLQRVEDSARPSQQILQNTSDATQNDSPVRVLPQESLSNVNVPAQPQLSLGWTLVQSTKKCNHLVDSDNISPRTTAPKPKLANEELSGGEPLIKSAPETLRIPATIKKIPAPIAQECSPIQPGISLKTPIQLNQIGTPRVPILAERRNMYSLSPCPVNLEPRILTFEEKIFRIAFPELKGVKHDDDDKVVKVQLKKKDPKGDSKKTASAVTDALGKLVEGRINTTGVGEVSQSKEEFLPNAASTPFLRSPDPTAANEYCSQIPKSIDEATFQFPKPSVASGDNLSTPEPFFAFDKNVETKSSLQKVTEPAMTFNQSLSFANITIPRTRLPLPILSSLPKAFISAKHLAFDNQKSQLENKKERIITPDAYGQSRQSMLDLVQRELLKGRNRLRQRQLAASAARISNEDLQNTFLPDIVQQSERRLPTKMSNFLSIPAHENMHAACMLRPSSTQVSTSNGHLGPSLVATRCLSEAERTVVPQDLHIYPTGTFCFRQKCVPYSMRAGFATPGAGAQNVGSCSQNLESQQQQGFSSGEQSAVYAESCCVQCRHLAPELAFSNRQPVSHLKVRRSIPESLMAAGVSLSQYSKAQIDSLFQQIYSPARDDAGSMLFLSSGNGNEHVQEQLPCTYESLNSLHDNSLFGLLYHDNDILVKGMARKVVHERGWRFQLKYHKWFIRAARSIELTCAYERGPFYYFDTVDNEVILIKNFLFEYLYMEPVEGDSSTTCLRNTSRIGTYRHQF